MNAQKKSFKISGPTDTVYLNPTATLGLLSYCRRLKETENLDMQELIRQLLDGNVECRDGVVIESLSLRIEPSFEPMTDCRFIRLLGADSVMVDDTFTRNANFNELLMSTLILERLRNKQNVKNLIDQYADEPVLEAEDFGELTLSEFCSAKSLWKTDRFSEQHKEYHTQDNSILIFFVLIPF